MTRDLERRILQLAITELARRWGCSWDEALERVVRMSGALDAPQPLLN